MNQRRLLLMLALGLQGASLMGGYFLVGNRIGLTLSGLCLLAWLLCWWLAARARRSAFTAVPSVSAPMSPYASALLPIGLFVSVGLAACGLLLGAHALAMIVAVASSLAVWDLLAFDLALSLQRPTEQSRRCETNHLRSLALALGSGLLLSGASRLLSLRLPFVIVLLLVAATVFALDRLWAGIEKSRSR